MSVKYNKISKTYYSESRTTGKIQYNVTDEPSLLVQVGESDVKINLMTYPEFIKQIKPNITDLKYVNKLASELKKYFNYLELSPFDLSFNVILIPENYRLLLKSDKLSTKKQPIKLTFVATLPKSDFGTEELELNLINLLPHELFHFLLKYENFPKINLLRNETYAHLFGYCIAYEMNPVIQDEMVFNFPEYFFKKPAADFIKVKNKVKKDAFVKDNHFPKSFLGRGLSRYYFQAVANERNGERIQSDKIPKFCHKLFSEHNFKYPIEKKPPPWFKAFLENNR